MYKKVQKNKLLYRVPCDFKNKVLKFYNYVIKVCISYNVLVVFFVKKGLGKLYLVTGLLGGMKSHIKDVFS